jgi:hypothetical protein
MGKWVMSNIYLEEENRMKREKLWIKGNNFGFRFAYFYLSRKESTVS